MEQAAAGPAGSVRAEGVFALGPWWEFDNFVLVSVTDEYLVMTPETFWIPRRRGNQRRVRLSEVAIRSRRIRRSPIGRPDVLVCKMSVAGKRTMLKAKNFPYAIRVLDALQQATAS